MALTIALTVLSINVLGDALTAWAESPMSAAVSSYVASGRNCHIGADGRLSSGTSSFSIAQGEIVGLVGESDPESR